MHNISDKMKFLGVELQFTFVYNQQGPRRNSTKPIPKILHLPILTPQRQVQYLFFYQLILSFREPAFQYIIHF